MKIQQRPRGLSAFLFRPGLLRVRFVILGPLFLGSLPFGLLCFGSLCFGLLCFGWLSPAGAQDDYSVLRLNEVIADNETQGPADKKGNHQDMVEIYNAGEKKLGLSSLTLSDTADPALADEARYHFPAFLDVEPKGFVVVFLSGNPDVAGDCQSEMNFGLARDGSEPLTLWGPKGLDGKRAVIDQVWLPPLATDVSFGRYPDGAGPAPVPVEKTFEVFRFNAKDRTTFGACGTAPCSSFEAPCKGAPNNPGDNLIPRVNRIGHSTNHPASGEPVALTVRVEDDKEPTPADIKTVVIRYSVDGAPQTDIPMQYDGSTGVLTGANQGRPLERWTVWTGSIPEEPAGSRVDFTFYVEDSEGLSSTDPFTPCAAGVGPCDDLGLPGPGCVKEPPSDPKYLECSVPFRYTVGYQPPEALLGLVVNEVMANQTKTLRDPSEPDHARYDDWIEIHNGSANAVDLSGLWLSDKPFQPQGWKFPPGSTIGGAGGIDAYLLVWCDSDGGKCPRPSEKTTGDGQECPDPTDPAKASYHTNFALETEGDQVYIFDRAESGYGVIHGVEFGKDGPQEADVSLSLLPDGDRAGTFTPTPAGTPGAPNRPPVVEASFRRGDSNNDCAANLTDAVFTLRFLFQGGDPIRCPDAADSDDNGAIQITDAIFLLNYLFQGGAAIPPPGEATAGPDPTADTLGECDAPACGA